MPCFRISDLVVFGSAFLLVSDRLHKLSLQTLIEVSKQKSVSGVQDFFDFVVLNDYATCAPFLQVIQPILGMGYCLIL